MAHAVVVDALATDRLAAARAITVEYVVLTQAEAGLPVPQDIRALPAPLRAIVDGLADNHRRPGALLLALDGEQVCGTVAMRRSTLTGGGRHHDGLVQRLYVREAFRRRGIAGELMAAVHGIAAHEGFHRLVLNVMATRVAAQALYAELGYRPLDEAVQWPYGGIWLCREVTSEDQHRR